MKNVLIVHPDSWRESDTAAVRMQLIGKPVQINASRSVECVPSNDVVLIIVGEEDGPYLLSEFGKCSTKHRIPIEYTCRADVAAKIASLL